MADIVDAATRSRMMSRIRGKNTTPEKFVRSALHRQGFRFRLNVKELPGKPDVVLPRHKAVVMVNGCFWHGHDCALFRLPKTRPEFWSAKISRNRANDLRAVESLSACGWRVCVVWECAIRGTKAHDSESLGMALAAWLRGGQNKLIVSSTDPGREK